VSKSMRIRLDRTMCDGFGICAKHAPEYFSLDDWGYASLVGNGIVPEADQDAVRRALFDCPVHAIIEMSTEPASAGAVASETTDSATA
jgi:ferredoxin